MLLFFFLIVQFQNKSWLQESKIYVQFKTYFVKPQTSEKKLTVTHKKCKLQTCVPVNRSYPYGMTSEKKELWLVSDLNYVASNGSLILMAAAVIFYLQIFEIFSEYFLHIKVSNQFIKSLNDLNK